MSKHKGTKNKTQRMRCPYCGSPVILRSADGIYRENSQRVWKRLSCIKDKIISASRFSIGQDQKVRLARHGDIMSKRAFWGVFIRLCEQCSYHVALYALHLCLLGDKGIDETPLITMSFVYQKMVYL